MSQPPDDGVRPMSVPPEHDPDAARPEPPGDDVDELEDTPDPIDALKRGDSDDQPGADPTPPPIPPG
ncbi:MAG: hypothetical protein H0W51_01855 [Euzebyales bacterium]|nr:hypothetical protein [Euzebyales bacterium]